MNLQTQSFLPSSRRPHQNSFKEMEVLTENAVAKLLSIENGMNEYFIVDLSRPKKNKKRLSLLISDGEQKFKGFIDINERTKDVEQLMKKSSRPALRVRITEHITHFQQNDPTEIEIVDFLVPRDVKLEANRSLKLEPEQFKPINPHFIPQTKPLDPQSLFPPYTSSQNPLEALIKENLKNNSNCRTLKLQCKSDDDTTESDHPLPARHDPYQTIAQLYESYYHWRIVVRIVDANYSEFISKKGKLIKLLTMELIDREGSIITATYFGDGGKARHSLLQVGKIYRICKGNIKEDNFNKHKKEKESKFCINITSDTQFSLLNDDIDIPYCRNNWLRLSQMSQMAQTTNLHQIYNFIAILADIQPPKEIFKDNRRIILRKLYVGDPSTGLVSQVTIWDHQITIDKQLLGKSILLKKFKVNRYKEDLKLSSIANSQIIPHPLFASFEGSCSFNIPKYDSNSSSVKTLKDLSEELRNSAANVSVYSTIDVWVKEMAFDKKWLYEACPSCRKSCSGNTSNRCQRCQAPIDSPNRCFKLEVRLADFSGSIWVTAFDDNAGIFLKETPMEQLFPMSNRELCEYAESYFSYEQFRISIKSYRDMLGQPKHSIYGKTIPINPAEAAQANLKRIALVRQEIRENERASFF